VRHLESLPNRFSIPIKPDKDGYLGRECPIKDCKGYFKITPGTGLKGPVPCHCPYCGHSGETLGYLTLWPSGEPQPVVSTLNSPGGSIDSNAAIVPHDQRIDQRVCQFGDPTDPGH